MTEPSTTLEPRPHQLPAGLTASLTAQVLARDQYACFRCGEHALATVISPWERAVTPQPYVPTNVISICNDCVTDVLEHRRRSIRLGYLIPAGNFNPSAIPVLHHRNGWVVLTGDGKWAKADPYVVSDWEERWSN